MSYNLNQDFYKCKVSDGSIQTANSVVSGVASSGTDTTLVDTSKNFAADMFNDMILRASVDGVDYYRKITDGDATSLTFSTLYAGTTAQLEIDEAGSKITAKEVGVDGNDYKLVVVEGTVPEDPLAASYEDGTITITGASTLVPAVAASVALDSEAIAKVDVKAAGALGNSYKLVVVEGTGESSALSAAYADGTLTITSATDELEAPVEIAPADLVAVFAAVPEVTALFSVSVGVTPGNVVLVEAPGNSFAGGADAYVEPDAIPAVDIPDLFTADEELNALFAVTLGETPGNLSPAAAPGSSFSGGTDTIVVSKGTEYQVINI